MIEPNNEIEERKKKRKKEENTPVQDGIAPSHFYAIKTISRTTCTMGREIKK